MGKASRSKGRDRDALVRERFDSKQCTRCGTPLGDYKPPRPIWCLRCCDNARRTGLARRHVDRLDQALIARLIDHLTSIDQQEPPCPPESQGSG